MVWNLFISFFNFIHSSYILWIFCYWKNSRPIIAITNQTMEFYSLFVASLIWGVTNPILKRNSQTKQDEGSFKIVSLFTNLSYLIPQGINLIGSVFFFYALSSISKFILFNYRINFGCSYCKFFDFYYY